jgi:serine/threonine-protein kinase SRPK3
MSEAPNYESDVEEYEDYKINGYHPAYIGEQFKNGRYRIIQKLGWGYFSTVWMAYDKQENKNIALKIQKSKESYAEAAEDEIELLNGLNVVKSSKEWEETRNHLNSTKNMNLSVNDIYNIEIIDNFIHYGMHGKHYCSTFDIMGPNLLDIITYFDDNYQAGIPVNIVKKITKQMLIAMDYMHRIANIIHTDLKPENIMIEIPREKMAAFEE